LTIFLSFAIVFNQIMNDVTESNGWLSLEETAAYLGMGKTALYAMAREGRIPARKIGKKWIFEKSGLDQWVRTARPLQSFFLDADFKIDGNDHLRDPQREGYLRTYEFFRAGKNKAMRLGIVASVRNFGRQGHRHRAKPHHQGWSIRGDGHHQPSEMLLAEIRRTKH
jgi:excisionase family DNA binding protein